MNYLAIDVGSSFIKSARLGLDPFVLSDFENLPTPGRKTNANPRIHEIDLEEIVGSVRWHLDTHIRARNSLRGILLTTQTHGFVLADHTGRPVTPYVSWQDRRCLDGMDQAGQSYLDYLRQVIDPTEMKKSGIALKPGLALPNLFAWLKTRSSPPERLQLFTLGSYIIFQLTGRNICHLTNAAATGLADIAAQQWNTALIKSLGFEAIQFPLIQKESESCGLFETGDHRIPIYPDIGDHHAVMLGSLMEPGGDVCINIGTAAQLTAIADSFLPGRYEVRPFFDGQFLNTVTGIPGGRCLDVLVNWIRDIGVQIFGLNRNYEEIWRQILECTAKPGKSSLLVKTGFFEGTVGVEEGAIANINPENLSVANLFTAAYQNMGETYHGLLERLSVGRWKPIRLVFAGGVSHRNAVLRQVIAERIGLPAILSPVPHEVFVGLLRVALVIERRCETVAESRSVLNMAGLEIKTRTTPPIRLAP